MLPLKQKLLSPNENDAIFKCANINNSFNATDHPDEPAEGERGVGVVGAVVELGDVLVLPLVVPLLEVLRSFRVQRAHRLFETVKNCNIF